MSEPMSFSRSEMLGLVFRLGFLSVASYFTVKWLVDAMDPTRKAKLQAKDRATAIMKRLGIPHALASKLDEYELTIASNLVSPESVNSSFQDIAGLDEVINELKGQVILPIQKRHLFTRSKLFAPPKGVLLHGPPGCGKTMLAKAMAKEAGTRFLNLDPSILHDKWYGESQKLATAVFRLAAKLEPCIIFIDEIDSLLRSRDSNDHEATALLKATFMQLWDGLATDPDTCVVVMGATNLPSSVDRAILRRLGATFYIPLPGLEHRFKILSKILADELCSDDVDLLRLANLTEGFSGSDLRELCRAASLQRFQELACNDETLPAEKDIRTLANKDLLTALQMTSRLHCNNQKLKMFTLD